MCFLILESLKSKTVTEKQLHIFLGVDTSAVDHVILVMSWLKYNTRELLDISITIVACIYAKSHTHYNL